MDRVPQGNMPRLRSLLDALPALLSALLLAAVVLLWVRSPHHADLLAVRSPGGFLQGIASEHAGILLFLSKVRFDGEYGPADADGRERVHHWAALSVPAGDFQMLNDDLFAPTARSFSKWGFRAASGNLTWYMDMMGPPFPAYHAIVVPDLILVLLLFPLSYRSAHRVVQKWYRARNGLCRGCGYDLRATPSGRCPECGRAIPARELGGIAWNSSGPCSR
jgi:hypothetical protein